MTYAPKFISFTSPGGITYNIDESRGEPYYLGRIMGFRNIESPNPEVRIAWFFREKDNYTIVRKRRDTRLLYATMHSDWNPFSSIRGKCTILHSNTVPNLKEYILQPDCFHYHQLVHKYSNKVYEVVPTSRIFNLPRIYLEALRQYDFILIEANCNRLTELLEKPQTCCICKDWCGDEDSVKCGRCSEKFHFDCLETPLSRKPAKGYVWECLSCSEQGGSHSPKETNHQIVLPRRTLRSTKSSDCLPAHGLKTASGLYKLSEEKKPFRLWPFRYFGIHSALEDALDVDFGEGIYPRTQSRVGSKFQAEIPSPKTNDTDKNETRKTQLICQIPRGLEEKVDVFIHQARNDLRHVVPISTHSTAFTEKALECLHNSEYVTNDALEKLLNATWDPLLTATWSLDEVSTFEQAFIEFGKDLLSIKKKIPTKSMKEVVIFYYNWRKTERYSFFRSQNLSKSRTKEPIPEGGSFHSSLVQVSSDYSPFIKDISDDDDESYFDKSLRSNKSRPLQPSFNGNTKSLSSSPVPCLPQEDHRCAVCHTKVSENWCKVPLLLRMYYWNLTGEKVKSKYLCESCGGNWLKYGICTATREEILKKEQGYRKPKKASSPKQNDIRTKSIKKHRRTSTQNMLTPKPNILKKNHPCSVCKEVALPNRPFLVCKGCNLVIHAVCYLRNENICPPDTDWYCDVCENILSPSASIQYHCLLCTPSSMSNFGEAMRKTNGNNWCHILCALWTPEMYFSDTRDGIEVCGAEKIPDWSWKEVCSICKKNCGACVKCQYKGCHETFHVTCGIKAGYLFDINNKDASSGKGGSQTIFCKQHIPTSGPNNGERKLPKSLSTQVEFIVPLKCHQKPMEIYDSTSGDWPLSRKSGKKRKLLNETNVNIPQNTCSICKVNLSPLWYDAQGEEASGIKYCHQCMHGGKPL